MIVYSPWMVETPGTVATGAATSTSWAVTAGVPITVKTTAKTQTPKFFIGFIGGLQLEQMLLHRS